jgi:act minimal PKS acyl carrier protein
MTMQPLTMDDLVRILTESAGAGDDLEQLVARPGTTFEDLGYDSLALLETAARLEQDLGISIPDDEITEAATPEALLVLVNTHLTEPA